MAHQELDLAKQLEALRKKGESLGLSDDEIDNCILKTLEEWDDSERPAPSTTRNQKPRSYFGICLMSSLVVFCVFVGVITGGAVYLSHNQSTAKYLGRQWGEFQYPVLRIIRFLALPMHRFFDLSSMQEWDCVIDNPAYIPDKPDCEVCAEVSNIPTRLSHKLPQLKFKKDFYAPGYSVKVKNVSGYGDEQHGLESVKNLYESNSEDMELDTCELYTDGANFTANSLQELFEKWEHEKPEGHVVGWKICYGKGFRKLRNLFPRPYFIHTEGALDKAIYLMQPMGDESTSVGLPKASFENVWVAQVTGTTLCQMKPIDECSEKCDPFEVRLEPGDVFYFTQHTWTATFVNPDRAKPAIIFTSSFA